MNTGSRDTAGATDGASSVEAQARALLDLIEADRTRQCALILGEAESLAATLRAQARAEARSRMRQAFAEQRWLRRERIAAAQARLATHRRLAEQRRLAALLHLASEQLPGELLALWKHAPSRAAWVGRVLAGARARMPRGPWRIVHATDLPAAERQAQADTLAADQIGAPRFEADDAIVAGLKVVADGNVIDGTLAGLVAERADFEARLLRHLESLP